MKSKCSYPKCKNKTEVGYCNRHNDYKRTRRFQKLKKQAKTRGIPVSITASQYYKLMEGASCQYCSMPITLTTGHSLDRKKSSVGYTLQNVVACCVECNTLKGASISSEEMQILIKALSKTRKTYPQSPWDDPLTRAKNRVRINNRRKAYKQRKGD